MSHPILSPKALLVLTNVLFAAVTVNGLPFQSVPNQLEIPASQFTDYALLPASHDPNINNGVATAPPQTCEDCFQTIRGTKPPAFADAYGVCNSIAPGGCAIKTYQTLYGALTPPPSFQAPPKVGSVCWGELENGEGAAQWVPTVETCPSSKIAARDVDSNYLNRKYTGAATDYKSRPRDPHSDDHNQRGDSPPTLVNGHLELASADGPDAEAGASREAGETEPEAGANTPTYQQPNPDLVD